MASITPTTPMKEVFDDVNVQKCLFKRAFEIVFCRSENIRVAVHVLQSKYIFQESYYQNSVIF